MEQVRTQQIVPLCSASNYPIRFPSVYAQVRRILGIPYNSVPFVFRLYPEAAEKVTKATCENGIVKLVVIKYTNCREDLFYELVGEMDKGIGMFKNTEYAEKFFYFDKSAWLCSKTKYEYTFSEESSEEEKKRIKENLYGDSDKYIIPRSEVILNRYQNGRKWLCILAESLWNALRVKAEGECRNYANELCSLFSLANENQFEIEHAKSEIQGETFGLKYFHRFYFSIHVYKLEIMMNYIMNYPYAYYLTRRQGDIDRYTSMVNSGVQALYRYETCIPRSEFPDAINAIKIVRVGNEIIIKNRDVNDEENFEVSGYPRISQRMQIMRRGSDVSNESIANDGIISIELNEEMEREIENIMMPRDASTSHSVNDIKNIYKKFDVFLYKDSYRYLREDFIDDSCIICREEFKDEDVVKRFFCGNHIFHKKCIKEWVSNYRVVCPICKYNMFDGRKEEMAIEKKISTFLKNKRYLEEP